MCAPLRFAALPLATLLVACSASEPPAAPASQAAAPPLLARDLLFGNPQRANGR